MSEHIRPWLQVAANFGIVGLHRDRTVSVLRASRDRAALPPLQVHEPPEPKRYRYRVRDGFYLSVVVGFPMLPVSVRPFFDFNAL
jgi:hypothetical protein